jgi:hypothetical protein
MVDLLIIALVALAAFGWRYVTDLHTKKFPNVTVGSTEHSRMPEMAFIPAPEVSELNASSFVVARKQEGCFSVERKTM